MAALVRILINLIIITSLVNPSCNYDFRSSSWAADPLTVVDDKITEVSDGSRP